MATKRTPKQNDSAPSNGELDTSYITHQRGMFKSGIVAQIGSHAYTVWSAIKTHADFETGECWPGIRHLMEMTGLASPTVQAAIKTLEEAHMLRVKRLGQKNVYVPRERLDVRIGSRIICTIVVDYVPLTMRERLAKLKVAAMAGDMSDKDVWADVELLPGPGMVLDAEKGTFGARIIADEVTVPTVTVAAMRENLRGVAEEMRKTLPKK